MALADKGVSKRRYVIIDGETFTPTIQTQHVQEGSSCGSSFISGAYPTQHNTPYVCGCNKRVIMLMSKTKENPNRPFWRCPLYKNEDLCCGFFQWVDNFEGMVPGNNESIITNERMKMKMQKKRIKSLEHEVRKLRIVCGLLLVMLFIVIFFK